MPQREILSPTIPASDLRHALDYAAQLRKFYRTRMLTSDLLLLAFIKQTDVEAHQILRTLSDKYLFEWSRFEYNVEQQVRQRRTLQDGRFDYQTSTGELIPLEQELLVVFDEGLNLSNEAGYDQCTTGYALVMLADERANTSWPLNRRDVDSERLLAELNHPVSRPQTRFHSPLSTSWQPLTAALRQLRERLSSEVAPSPPRQSAGQQTAPEPRPAPAPRPTRPRPQTASAPPPPPAGVQPQPAEATPVYQRETLMGELIGRLSIKHGRHLILLGPSGVGKRSLFLGLAERIQQQNGPLGLVNAVEVDEQQLVSQPKNAILSSIHRAQSGGAGVLFVSDIARFFGGVRADMPEEACTALQQAFYNDQIVIIGTATEPRYKKLLEPSSLVAEQCQTMTVPAATVEETTAILTTLQPTFERDYQLKIADKTLAEVAKLAERYYPRQPLPGGAVYVLHWACALVKTGHHTAYETESRDTLSVQDVMATVSRLAGVPISHMGADERDRYINMVDKLHEWVIGQNEAIESLSRAVKMARVGLKDANRPIGSFLFLGPTGVGKTELAKALAEFMFGTEDALITLDMSEYMEDSSINRFIGSPPGYVGHEAGGQLTDAVKARPYSVVLFDEVEKASLKVFDALLQVLDEGRLTSGQGELVRFNQAVILMTSNIGGRYLTELSDQPEEARLAAEETLKAHFRPEFLNRLDDIIYFHALTPDDLRQILELMLRKEISLLAENRNISLTISDEAKTWLLAQNEHPEWGARPLRRLIQRHVRQPLAEYLLAENPTEGTALTVDLAGQGLQIS